MKLNANKLAAENGISRRVLSIRFDDKRNQWCVTHETSKGYKEDTDYRADVDYYIFDLTEDFNINAALNTIKAEATLAFLGLVEIDTRSSEAPERQLTEAPQPIAEEKPPRRRRRTKAEIEAEKERLKKEKEAAAEAEKPEVQLDPPEQPPAAEEEDPLGMESEVEAPLEPVLYQKNKTDHAVHLRDLIEEKFGKAWKKDKNAVTVVKGLVSKLNGKVAVIDGNGEVLPTFTQFVTKYFAKAA